MARPGIDPEQDGRIAPLGGLQRGGKLQRVAGHDPVVVIAGQQQGRRVVRAGLHVVQRRVRPQPAILLRVAGVAQFAHPGPADSELVKPQHVEDPDLGNARAEQGGLLGHARADEEPAVGPAHDRGAFRA